MGKAFCAVADDGSAVYWNPAGLGQIKQGQISLEYTRWFEDVAFTGVNGVYPFRKTAIGGFANVLLTDETQVTTAAKPSGTGKTFHETDGIFGVAGRINLTDCISFGVTGKIISQKIGDEDAMRCAGDLGFLCKLIDALQKHLANHDQGIKILAIQTMAEFKTSRIKELLLEVRKTEADTVVLNVLDNSLLRIGIVIIDGKVVE